MYPPHYHGNRRSCAWDPSGSCPMYLFIWLLICVLYNKLEIGSKCVSTVICSSKIMEPKESHGNLPSILGESEAQVTTWTCDWHLKLRGVQLCGTQPLNLWDMTPSPGVDSVRTELNWRTPSECAENWRNAWWYWKKHTRGGFCTAKSVLRTLSSSQDYKFYEGKKHVCQSPST